MRRRLFSPISGVRGWRIRQRAGCRFLHSALSTMFRRTLSTIGGRMFAVEQSRNADSEHPFVPISRCFSERL